MRLYSLIVDAGPLIALFSAQDRDHALCRSGFEQLAVQQISIRIPLPVLFEVYKWLPYHATYNQAQIALLTMQESLEVDPINLADLSELTLMVQSLTNWKGSLEDASVIHCHSHGSASSVSDLDAQLSRSWHIQGHRVLEPPLVRSASSLLPKHENSLTLCFCPLF